MGRFITRALATITLAATALLSTPTHENIAEEIMQSRIPRSYSSNMNHLSIEDGNHVYELFSHGDLASGDPGDVRCVMKYSKFPGTFEVPQAVYSYDNNPFYCGGHGRSLLELRATDIGDVLTVHQANISPLQQSLAWNLARGTLRPEDEGNLWAEFDHPVKEVR